MQPLKDLMSRDVKVVSPDMTIEEAARSRKTRKPSRLPRRFRKISKPPKPLRYHLRPS